MCVSNIRLSVRQSLIPYVETFFYYIYRDILEGIVIKIFSPDLRDYKNYYIYWIIKNTTFIYTALLFLN